MKIIVDKAIPFIEGRFPVELRVEYVPSEEITPEIVKDADALIIRTRTKCDGNLLKESKVKLISTATIGTDHIDIPWCEAHNISVKNAPGCNAPGVAQYVLASLFKAGFDTHKDILGIIGYGHVGQIVKKWAEEMGIKVLICDPPRKDSVFNDVDYLSLENLLKHSDAVTLHVPLTQTGIYPTFHMIGENQLNLMKDDSILVNSSRGGVVDEKALKNFLRNGKIKGIIDVWENEPEIDRELTELIEIGTPHIAGYSEEGKKRATRMALEALNETLGIKFDTSGLECKDPFDNKMTRERIISSYDPFIDSENLLRNPSLFESLRNNYNYRHEP